ncbi:hypothetical protein B0T10DRAFT_297393 [Thelonectria olida]|uniref:Uncharacterized protein n=1 Tax=Thelonectria olida TaxID=1576542 RepID=A0A9P9AJL0_9HYPO|nr:hypothetical protein B0T10DRAFT_297393 [Thelonectria olida]
MTKITKVKLARTTDEELLEECKNEMQCGDCDITWINPPKGTRIQPPANTVVVVVDVPENKGAIRVFKTGTDKHLGTVGTEDAGYMVVVPWDNSWWFRVSGSLTVGYIVLAE